MKEAIKVSTEVIDKNAEIIKGMINSRDRGDTINVEYLLERIETILLYNERIKYAVQGKE